MLVQICPVRARCTNGGPLGVALRLTHVSHRERGVLAALWRPSGREVSTAGLCFEHKMPERQTCAGTNRKNEDCVSVCRMYVSSLIVLICFLFVLKKALSDFCKKADLRPAMSVHSPTQPTARYLSGCRCLAPGTSTVPDPGTMESTCRTKARPHNDGVRFIPMTSRQRL